MTIMVRFEARSGREEGAALMIAVFFTLMLTALGAALVLIASSEETIASNYRSSFEARYAAESALKRAIDDLQTVTSWTDVLAGSARSAFVDGWPTGTRVLPDRSILNLDQIVSMANCEKPTPCSSDDMDRLTLERPWGPNNPRWTLYAYGKLATLIPAGTINSSFYVLVLAGDDSAENDGDAERDGSGAENPGAGVIALRAEAFGPRGAHKRVEATVRRISASESAATVSSAGDAGGIVYGGAGTGVLVWREVQ